MKKLDEKYTLVELLRAMNDEFEKQKAKDIPFNERELAKAELVRSLLRKVDNGRVLVS
jgi:hypothetical protein